MKKEVCHWWGWVIEKVAGEKAINILTFWSNSFDEPGSTIEFMF